MLQMTQLRRKKCTNIIFFILVLVIPTQNQPISFQPVIPWIKNHKKLTAAIIFFGLLFNKKRNPKIINKILTPLAKNLILEPLIFLWDLHDFLYFRYKRFKIKRGDKNEARLFMAVEDGDLGTVKECITNGSVNVNIRAKHTKFTDGDGYRLDGETVLVKAIRRDYTKIAQYLIEQCANVNESKDEIYTPLMAAAEYGNTRIVRLLLEKGAGKTVNNRDYSPGYTALMYASCFKKKDREGDNSKTVRLLLTNGADKNYMQKYGSTASTLAAEYCDTNVLSVLILSDMLYEKNKVNTLFSKAIKLSNRYRKTSEEVVKTVSMLIKNKKTVFCESAEADPIKKEINGTWKEYAPTMLKKIENNVENYFQQIIITLSLQNTPEAISSLIVDFLLGSNSEKLLSKNLKLLTSKS